MTYFQMTTIPVKNVVHRPGLIAYCGEEGSGLLTDQVGSLIEFLSINWLTTLDKIIQFLKICGFILYGTII